MDFYLTVKTLHILSSTVLFGTGIGIAFFMFCSYFAQNIGEKLFISRLTVISDYLFTAPAVVVQPVTGFVLLSQGGYAWNEFWLAATFVLFAVSAICWLAVLVIQIKMKNLLAAIVQNEAELPDRYHTLFKAWFVLGWPALFGLVTVFFLMVFKPT
ncbi:MAG: DUF2269 domain-containing protein [Rhizobiaceae bacterium]